MKGSPIFSFSVLSSGSGGNSIYVESGVSRILLDAGLSVKELTLRLSSIGRKPEDLDAVFLTHEHTDHVRGAGPLARRHNLPLYSTEGTLRRIGPRIGTLPRWEPLRSGRSVIVGDLCVEPYTTPHDAQEPVAFLVHHDSLKLAVATDLGHVTPLVRQRLKGAHALLVESNHDLDLLVDGPYSHSLKQRIRSDVGHLSNEACGELLASVVHRDLRRVVLMHMSETNNRPQLVEAMARQVLSGTNVQTQIALQDRATSLISV